MTNCAIIPRLSDSPAKLRYKMIESITVENFRCYEHLTVRNLTRINVIVGRNGSGKTAFLEALFFNCGGPVLVFKLKGWRGMPGLYQVNEFLETRNAPWRDLFYKFEQDRIVKIHFRGSDDVTRRVEIHPGARETQFVRKGQSSISEMPSLEFQYFRGKHKLPTVRPIFTKDGIEIPNSPEPMVGHFYPASSAIDPKETATLFSSLSKRGKIPELVKAVQSVFCEIQGLSLEIEGGVPTIFAQIDGMEEKVPIGLVSSGVSRFLMYLTAIASQEKGIVMIDEIESGFYFERMKDIWHALYAFSEANEVQLFISTHSAECLQSMESVVESHPDGFTLLRAVRSNGKSTIKQFEGRDFLAALEEDVEIR